MIDVHSLSLKDFKNLAGSQGWAMCLRGTQQSCSHYPNNKSGWKMDGSVMALTVVQSIPVDRGGGGGEGGWGVWRGGVSPGLCCPQLLYVCLISQFISRA